VVPVFDSRPSEVGGKGRVRFALGFSPFTLARDKWLVVELAGVDGRVTRMAVKAKLLLRAKAE
jgi:hypothetical protein